MKFQVIDRLAIIHAASSFIQKNQEVHKAAVLNETLPLGEIFESRFLLQLFHLSYLRKCIALCIPLPPSSALQLTNHNDFSKYSHPNVD